MAACGSTTGGSATPTPTPHGPSGPPAAQFTITGDPGLAGALAIGDVECQFPGVNGALIVTNVGPANTTISIRMTVGAGSVALRVDTGSGPAYRERDFNGTGVTAFDAANGAQINSQLTETTPAGQAASGVGAVTSITGSIDCMQQQPGSATVTISGGPSNVASGALTSVRVLCSNVATGNTVQILGIGHAGTTPVFVGLFLFTGGFNLFSSSLFYKGQPSATETLTATGAHVDGDALWQATTATSTDIVHVSGDATCGSSTKP
jgi:hypothetical protein